MRPVREVQAAPTPQDGEWVGRAVTYGFLLPGRFLLQLVVQKVHRFPADGRQGVAQQPTNHRNECFRGQQGIDLESSLH